MKIIFFGTADFGIAALDYLLRSQHEVQAIVTTPDRAQGRGQKHLPSPIKRFVTTSAPSIPIFEPEDLSSADLAGSLSAFGSDVFVVVAYKILPEQIFLLPRLATVNIHASLLPRYRGAAPIQRAIENGESTTGVTVFAIDKGIDTGNIICQRSCEIQPTDTTPDLYHRLSQLGPVALAEALTALKNNTPRTVQQSADATGAPKLKKSEGCINWHEPAAVIERRIRAFIPFPGSWCHRDNRRLSIISASVEGQCSTNEHVPGTVIAVTKDSFSVLCGKGTILRIHRVKPEAKKIMDVQHYLHGQPIKEFEVLQ